MYSGTMNTLARTIRTRVPLISFTSRSFWLFVVIVGFIILILFLPDIAGIHVRRNGEVPLSVDDSPRSADSPLNEILAQISEIDKRKPFEPTVREAANEKLRTSDISWETIRSEPVKVALNTARSEAATILDKLPHEMDFSRFALANYIQGIEQLLAAREERFGAREALAYVRYLDREVTRRFNEESVDSEIFRDWEKVSLGDALRAAENRQYREESAPPFKPEFALNIVRVHRVPPSLKVKPSDFNDWNQLSLEGSVVFRGIRRISVFHGKTFVKEIELPKPPKRGVAPFGYFSVNVDAVDGVFSFRIESDDEEVIIRRYVFYPRIATLVGNPTGTDFMVGRGHDRVPGLDNYFLVGVSQPNSEVEGMVAF